MIDLGQKISELKQGIPSTPDKNKVSYPSFYIDKEIPLTEKDIGKEITAICKMKLRSISKRSDSNENKYSCSFDVLGIDFSKGKTSHYKNKED